MKPQNSNIIALIRKTLVFNMLFNGVWEALLWLSPWTPAATEQAQSFAFFLQEKWREKVW